MALCRSMKRQIQIEKPLARVCALRSLLHVAAFWLRSSNTCGRAGGKFYKRFVWELISVHSDAQTQNTDAMTGRSRLCTNVGCAFHSVEIQTWEHYHCVSCPDCRHRHCACSLLTFWSNWIIDPWIPNIPQNNKILLEIAKAMPGW